MIPCIVLVANICLNDVSTVNVRQGGLSGSLIQVQGNGYTMVIDPGGDNIKTPDWKRMANACANDVCVAYFKRCEAAAGSIACEYHFSQPGERQNTVIRLTSSNRDALALAESRIGVLSRAGLDVRSIPLSSFSVESTEKQPPYCRPRTQSSECWPYQ